MTMNTSTHTSIPSIPSPRVVWTTRTVGAVGGDLGSGELCGELDAALPARRSDAVIGGSATLGSGTAMAGTAMAGTAMAGTAMAGTAMAGTAMLRAAMADTVMANPPPEDALPLLGASR
jgi:hypothetical protein